MVYLYDKQTCFIYLLGTPSYSMHWLNPFHRLINTLHTREAAADDMFKSYTISLKMSKLLNIIAIFGIRMTNAFS